MPKMDEYPAKVFVVFFEAMIKFFDGRLLEKSEDVFFKLAAPFARNDLDTGDALATASLIARFNASSIARL